jgi:S-adenosylmethionine-diacylglycerol 3-amino-3-carboxypropyl transferase
MIGGQARPRLRYANCWEDADLLVDRIGDIQGKRVLSIASGGDNSFSLLCRGPELVAVVDKNPAQISLFELKRAAIRALEREDFLDFMGYAGTRDRWGTYRLLRGEMEPAARAFWDGQRARIETGVVHTGNTAVRLRFFSHFVRPLIHGASRSRELMAPKSEAEQARFYRVVWDNRRWRAAGRILFSKPAVLAVTPDRSFFDFYRDGVATQILERTARHLSTTTAQRNYMLYYLLFGGFGRLVPHYAREENYAKVKDGLASTVTSTGYVQAVLPGLGRFDGFNLSNIVEYTTPESFKALAEVLGASANFGARLAYWNVFVPRKLSEAAPGLFEDILDTGRDRDVPDRGWIYSRFLVDRRRRP